jgi:hypothetical protein
MSKQKKTKPKIDKERIEKDNRTELLTRTILQVIGNYSSSLAYNINIEEETIPYIKTILELSTKEDISIEDFRFCIAKIKDLSNYILDGVDKAIDMSEESFIRKVFGKNLDEIMIKELHNTLLGNITYERKS